MYLNQWPYKFSTFQFLPNEEKNEHTIQKIEQ